MDTTVLKALDVIEALARSERPRGITELADQLQLTKSNVHRLLQTLASRGYLRRAKDRKVIHIDGLWGLGFGNDGLAGSSHEMYFTAGPNDESQGLVGVLRPVSPSFPPVQ